MTDAFGCGSAEVDIKFLLLKSRQVIRIVICGCIICRSTEAAQLLKFSNHKIQGADPKGTAGSEDYGEEEVPDAEEANKGGKWEGFPLPSRLRYLERRELS